MKHKGHRILKLYTMLFCVILLAVSFFCTACSPLASDSDGNGGSATTTAAPQQTTANAVATPSAVTASPEATMVQPTPEPTEDLSMYAVNPITGVQNMDKANEGKRPLAIMISNIKKATPQFGITECDMYYEIEAEGGITRIMGIFADVSEIPSIVGPVRSAREYYVDLAIGYNAVFAHYGTSTTAQNRISKYDVDNLDGMFLSKTFWRDAERKKTAGSVHSAVTSGEKLAAAITSKKYSATGSIGNFFQFYHQNNFTQDGSLPGTTVSAKFSGSTTAVFDYNAQDRLYYKSQFGAPHVDDDGKQIAVTNVIVLYTNIKVVDDEGHLSVALSKGKGYYFSGGVGKEITWSKGAVTNPIRYYNTDGSELTVNAGKTYVCIVRSEGAITNS